MSWATFVHQHDANHDHGQLRACVDGRTGDALRLGSIDIHAHVIRSVLVPAPRIVDYQTRQTPRDTDIHAIAPTSNSLGKARRGNSQS